MTHKMFSFTRIILAFILILAFQQGYAEISGSIKSDQEDSLRVLVIGNSFSNNATTFLPQLAEQESKKLKLAKAQIGGASLQRHWDAVKLNRTEPDNPKGKPYAGKSLKMFLEEDSYDIVTIQQVSILSCDTSEYRPYARKLNDLIRAYQPDANIVFHQTWAYRSDANRFCQMEEGIHAKTDEEMWRMSRAAYHALAKELGLGVIPVGDAFWKVASGDRGYQPSSDVDYDKIAFPDLPPQINSLHKGYHWREQELKFDANHASTEGCFLGSLVWYGFLFGESPEGLEFVPEGINKEFALYLKEIAATVLEE